MARFAAPGFVPPPMIVDHEALVAREAPPLPSHQRVAPWTVMASEKTAGTASRTSWERPLAGNEREVGEWNGYRVNFIEKWKDRVNG